MNRVREAALAVGGALAQARKGLVEREVLLEWVVLAAVAREHLLVIGPPGTAKSEGVRRVSRALGAKRFEYLLGRFTEPSELFGPIDLQRLQQGVVETRTEGMLPEAELVFLDEVFLGSTAILNTLLGVLNERQFRRGSTVIDCPLRVCVGASNAVPEEDELAAFADRFLLHTYAEPVGDNMLEALLRAGWSGGRGHAEPKASLADLDCLSEAARAMDLRPIQPLLADVVRTLRGHGIHLSDRRVVKVQSLVAAAAALDGRAQASAADLWPLVFAVPGQAEQAKAQEVLQTLLKSSESQVLQAAAEAASHGRAAQARRLASSAEELLETVPEHDSEAAGTWRLRVEGVLREVDASFDPQALPPVLEPLYPRLLQALPGS